MWIFGGPNGVFKKGAQKGAQKRITYWGARKNRPRRRRHWSPPVAQQCARTTPRAQGWDEVWCPGMSTSPHKTSDDRSRSGAQDTKNARAANIYIVYTYIGKNFFPFFFFFLVSNQPWGKFLGRTFGKENSTNENAQSKSGQVLGPPGPSGSPVSAPFFSSFSQIPFFLTKFLDFSNFLACHFLFFWRVIFWRQQIEKKWRHQL